LFVCLFVCFFWFLINVDYKSHACLRDCMNAKPMECVYNFTLEWYIVLSRACGQCAHEPLSEDCYRPGCITSNGYKRALKVVNRMLPGPSIQVCKNDRIIVNLNNKLNSFEATTIHWHGIKQQGSPHMDGIGMLTQCPITPNTIFQYE
jgi:L-ascorbate oxidase